MTNEELVSLFTADQIASLLGSYEVYDNIVCTKRYNPQTGLYRGKIVNYDSLIYKEFDTYSERDFLEKFHTIVDSIRYYNNLELEIDNIISSYGDSIAKLDNEAGYGINVFIYYIRVTDEAGYTIAILPSYNSKCIEVSVYRNNKSYEDMKFYSTDELEEWLVSYIETLLKLKDEYMREIIGY